MGFNSFGGLPPFCPVDDADDGHFDDFLDSGIPNGEKMDSDEHHEKKEKATDDISFLVNSGHPNVEEMESVMPQIENTADTIAELKEKVKQLERKLAISSTKPMPEDELQNIIVALKLGETKRDFKEGEMGYKFPNDTYLRLMMMSQGDFSSGKEQMEHMLMCSVSMNRSGGNYGERSDKDEASKKKEPPQKRQRKKELSSS